MLLYFTATGNSLYVAKKLSTNLTSIPQVMKSGQLEFEDETIGIVCPIYAGEAPRIVLDFIRKAKIQAEYFYVIMTYGNDHTDAAECTERFAAEFGLKIDYINTVRTVDNYLPVFDMNEQMRIDKKVDEQINLIAGDLAAKTRKIPQSTEQERALHAMVAGHFQANPSLNNGENIVMKENCNGCATCSRVCPIGNINMDNGKANRRESACDLFCLACVQNCPQKAIGLRMERNPDARYRNEHITLQEIVAANNQYDHAK